MFVDGTLLSTAPMPFFTPDVPGSYSIELTVTDGCSVAKTKLSVSTLCPNAARISVKNPVANTFA